MPSGPPALPLSRIHVLGALRLDPAVVSVATATRLEPPPGPLYLHVDVDVVDPADMPAMNYPAPGGPSLAEVRSAVAQLAATGRVAAFSMSVWNPELPGADAAAAACAKLAEPFVG